MIHGLVQRAQQEQRPLFALQRAWPRLVGRGLAAHTRPASLRRGRLVVAVDRPGEAFTLTLQREQILRQVNALVSGVVREVVLRPSGPEQMRRR